MNIYTITFTNNQSTIIQANFFRKYEDTVSFYIKAGFLKTELIALFTEITKVEKIIKH